MCLACRSFERQMDPRSMILALATRLRMGFCTQIGKRTLCLVRHHRFQRTAATSSILLRAGHDDYVINAEALAYMRQRALSGPVIARLAEHPDQVFADQAAWTTHLDRLGIMALRVNPDPVMVATEGALWGGSIKAHGFFCPTR